MENTGREGRREAGRKEGRKEVIMGKLTSRKMDEHVALDLVAIP